MTARPNSLSLRGSSGFTLIELIGAVAIISILAAIIVPNVFSQIRKSRVSRVLSTTEDVRRSTLAFYADNDRWPAEPVTDGAMLALLIDPGASFPKWRGPYLNKAPKVRAVDNRFADLYNGFLMVNDLDDGAGDDSGPDENGNGLMPDRFVYYGLVPAGDAAILDSVVDGAIDTTRGAIVLASGSDWSVTNAGNSEVLVIFDEAN
ncbi:MAG: prepilin-type N-terminal cleavage/methylation domain-containing protein [bacterium]